MGIVIIGHQHGAGMARIAGDALLRRGGLVTTLHLR